MAYTIRRAAAERRLSYGSLVCKAGPDRLQEEELTSVAPATGILPTTTITAHEQDKQDAQVAKTPGAAAAFTICDDVGTQQLEEVTGEGLMRLNLSLPHGDTKAARDVLEEQQYQQTDREPLSPKGEGEGILPPLSLVALLALFLFLCVGVEVGFGAWVAVVVLRDGLSGEASAIRMARCV